VFKFQELQVALYLSSVPLGWDSNLKSFIKFGQKRFALTEAISALYSIFLLASGTSILRKTDKAEI